MCRLYLPFGSWSVCPESSYVLWERAECIYLVLGLSLARHLRSHFPFQVTGFDLNHVINAVNTLWGILVTYWFSLLFKSWLLSPCAFNPNQLPQLLSHLSCVYPIWAVFKAKAVNSLGLLLFFSLGLLLSNIFLCPSSGSDHFLQDSSESAHRCVFSWVFNPLHSVRLSCILAHGLPCSSDSPLRNVQSASVSHSCVILPGNSQIRPVWLLWGQYSDALLVNTVAARRFIDLI